MKEKWKKIASEEKSGVMSRKSEKEVGTSKKLKYHLSDATLPVRQERN